MKTTTIRIRPGVTLSVFLFVLTVFTVLATFSSLEGRQHLSDRRSPVFSRTQETAAFAYRQDGTTLGGRIVSIMYYEPIDPAAARPPGLKAWPDPGSVAVSPALLADADAIAGLYGPVSSVIDEVGLLSPDEAIIYVRPADSVSFLAAASTEHGRVFFASGFGLANGLKFGDISYEQQSYLLYLILALTLVPVAVIYLAQVSRSFHHSMDRDVRILAALGASPSQLRRTKAAESWKSVALGALTAAAVLSVFVIQDVRLPFNGFVMRHADLAARGGFYVAATGGALVVCGALLVAPAGATRHRTRRARVLRSVSTLILFFGGIALAVNGGLRLLRLDLGIAPVAMLLVGLLLAVSAISGVLALITSAVAGRVAPVRASRLEDIFVQWTMRHAREVTRTGSLFALFLVCGTVLTLFYVTSYSSATRGFSAQDVRGRFVSIDPKCEAASDPGCVLSTAREIISRVGPRDVVLARGHDSRSGARVVLLAGALPRDNDIIGSDRAAFAEIAGETAIISGDIPTAESTDFFVYSPSATLTLSTFYSLAVSRDSLHPVVADYDPYFSAGSVFQHQSRWVTYFGSIAFFIMAVASTEVALRRLDVEGRELAPLAALTGSSAALARASRSRTAIVVSVALALGIALAAVIGYPIARAQATGLPVAYFVAVSLVFVVSTIVQQSAAETFLRRQAHAWKCGGTNA